MREVSFLLWVLWRLDCLHVMFLFFESSYWLRTSEGFDAASWLYIHIKKCIFTCTTERVIYICKLMTLINDST